MRKLAGILLCAAVLSASAQDSAPAPGPVVNVHLVNASGSEIVINPEGSVSQSGRTTSSSGGGITLDYGFTRWFGIYTTADVAGKQSVTVGSLFTGDLSMNQVDVGLRFQWPLAHGRVVPYGLVAFSYRLLSGPGTATASDVSGTVDVWGPAFTYGIGLQLFATKQFALDLSYLGSSVKYRETSLPNNLGGDTHSDPVSATRFETGVTWQIGPVGPPPPAPSQDTLALGERVRVQAGRVSLSGTVLVTHADTIVLQQVRHDTAIQVEVPRACITAAWRQLPSHATTAGLLNGAFIGGIAVTLLGAYLQSSEQNAPEGTGHILLHYTLPAAVLGAAVGAVVGNNDVALQRLQVPPAPSAAASGSAACSAWHPPA